MTREGEASASGHGPTTPAPPLPLSSPDKRAARRSGDPGAAAETVGPRTPPSAAPGSSGLRSAPPEDDKRGGCVRIGYATREGMRPYRVCDKRGSAARARLTIPEPAAATPRARRGARRYGLSVRPQKKRGNTRGKRRE